MELEGEVERLRAFWESECKRIADERDALNVEIVAQARSMAVERGLLSRCERPDVVAALRLQLAQEKEEVERLRGVVVESDKDLVVNAARKIARDHNMPLKSAEWMMLEALRVVRSNDNRDRDAAIARAEKAEKERDEARGDCGGWWGRACARSIARATAAEKERDEAREAYKQKWTVQQIDIVVKPDPMEQRATAAEAREAGLKAALNMMDESCWQAWKAFAEEGPDAAEKFLRSVCVDEGIMNEDGCRVPRAALAAPAPAKGEKPCG